MASAIDNLHEHNTITAHMKRILQSIVMLFCMLIWLSAATITHTFTVFPAVTDWSLTNSVPQFDPSLGALTNVTVGVGVNAANVIKVESRSNLPRTVAGGGVVAATATAAGYSAIATLTNSHTRAVSGFDGVIDYGGTSGFTTNLVGSASASEIPSDFTPFIGVGNIPLVASAVANGFYRGPADYAFEVATQASALVTVTYEFSPPVCPECPSCDPEPDCKPNPCDDRRKPRNKRR
jgi:hypothetical protein